MPPDSTNGTNGTHETNRKRVEAFVLKQRPNPVCARCVASALGLRPSAVQRAATVLEGVPGFIRQHTSCATCGNVRLSVRASAG